MPSRARLSSPSEIGAMTSSRYGVPIAVLANKKALDVAFMKHTWEMQKQAAALASGEKKSEIAAGRSSGMSNVLTQAVKIAQDNLIDLNTPEGQMQFEQIYQTLLNQYTGGQAGASSLATGAPSQFTPPSSPGAQPGPQAPGEPPWLRAGKAFFPPMSPIGGASRIISNFRKAGEAKKANQGQNQAKPGEPTATNPKTGERMVYRDGRWQKL